MKNNLGFWRSIGAPDFILSIIENGYRLPFISFPLAVKLGNNKSARLHADFVDQAVLELVNSGRVRMVKKDAYIFSFDLKSGYPAISTLRKSTKLFWGFHGGRRIPLMEYFMFSLCSRSVFPLPLMFSQQGFEALRKVLESTGSLYNHLLGRWLGDCSG